jgi:hypothetical protein
MSKTIRMTMILALAISYVWSFAQISANVIVSGSWNANIPSSTIIEAGNNYTGNYASASNQVQISHTVNPFWYWGHSWTVEIRKNDVNWDTSLKLYARRTGNGSGQILCSSTITGGLSYQEITGIDTYFYSGRCNRSNVPIQYELRNLSVLIPAGNQSTTITYTVTVTAN